MRPIIAIAACLITVSHLAYAEERACCRETSRLYVGGGIMAILPNEVSIDESIPVQGNLSYDLKPGYGFNALVGYQVYPNASFELEGIIQQSKVGQTNGFIPSGTKGSQKNTSLMVNHRWVYRNLGNIAPYLGAGAGIMYIKSPFTETLTVGPNSEAKQFKDTVFAYQFMAGANFAVPGTKYELYAGYRYIGSQDGETSFNIIPGYTQKYNVSSHNLEMGARFRF